MSNFVSDAITKGRVTMKPNLKVGPFLNGRSSAAVQPADLDFYHYEIKPGEPRISKVRKSNSQQRAESSLQAESDFFANIRANERSNTKPPDPTRSPDMQVSEPTGAGSDGADAPTSWSTHQQMPAVGRVRDSMSSIVMESGSNESHIDGLLECGVYDDTGITGDRILALHTDTELRERLPIKSQNQRLQHDHPCAKVELRRSSYRDKAVMVSPGLEACSRMPLPRPRIRTCNTVGTGYDMAAEMAQVAQVMATESNRCAPPPGFRRRTVTAQDTFEADFRPQRRVSHEHVDMRHYRETGRNPNRAASARVEGVRPKGDWDTGQSARETIPETASGSHTLYRFPGNIPFVYPLRHGVSAPRVGDSSWTRLGTTANIPQSPLAEPRQKLMTSAGRAGGFSFDRGFLGESTGADADTPVPDIISRLEYEVLDERGSGRRANQNLEWLERGPGFDKEMVDLQLHHCDAAGWTDMGDELGRLGEQGRAFELGTGDDESRHERQATAFRRGQRAHEREDLDLAGFWRPNCLR